MYSHLGQAKVVEHKLVVLGVIAQGCGQTLGLGLGQSKDIVVVFYQFTTDKGIGDRHMTWKLCDRIQSGLEGLRVQKELGLGVTSRDMGSSWCRHSVYMYSGD